MVMLGLISIEVCVVFFCVVFVFYCVMGGIIVLVYIDFV